MTSPNSATPFFERLTHSGARWLGVEDRTTAGALLFATLLLAATLSLLAIAPVWKLYGALPDDALRSDRVRVMHELATRWSVRAPDVLFLGGSQVRESLPAEAFIERELSTACGRPVSAFNAATSAQLPESSRALFDALPASPALVVTGVNLWRDARGRAQAARLQRALLPLGPANGQSGNLDLNGVQRLRARLGILFADAMTAMRGKPRANTDDPFDSATHQYSGGGWNSTQRTLDGQYQRLAAWEVEPGVVDANVAAYRSLARRITTRGGAVSYLLTPMSPEAAAQIRALDARAAPAFAELAQDGDMIDLRGAGLASGDFHDSVHPLAAGRRKLWPALRAQLIAQLPGCGGSQ